VNQHHDNPVNITSARPGRSSDISRRQARYLTSMGIRTACFVLAVLTTGPLRWAFVVGAVILPYVAVVLANATDRRGGVGPSPFDDERRPELEAGPADSDRDRP